MSEIKVFNRWESEGIEIEDPGLKPYITTKPVIVPKSGARYAGQKFYKSKIHIVERLINRVMVTGHRGKKHKVSSGHNTGKATKAYEMVKEALEIVEKKTKENPVKVLVKAIENGAAREETITIEYGGARYPKAVEMSPQRRIDQVLKIMTQSAYQKSFNSKRAAPDVLANEILAAYNRDQSSAVISKKLELERQADASR